MRTSSALYAGGVLKRSSYYKPDYTQSAALIRARRPYLFRNTITGVCIASFAIGVFAFTLRAVGQERFDDVVVPETPAGVASPAAGPPVQPPSNLTRGGART